MGSAAAAAGTERRSGPGERSGPQQRLGPVGLRWNPRGYTALSGELLALAERCDAAFVLLGGGADTGERPRAEEYPALLAAEDLAPVGYLASFPHLATFAVSLAPDEDNLRRFAASVRQAPAGEVPPAAQAPVGEVLTPAACYHVYAGHRGEELAAPLTVTTRNTCFRREAHYAPLRRQWSFRMRELVRLGTREEVRHFLAVTRAALDRFLAELDLPAGWEAATDPFFDPAAHPQYLAQKLRPTKFEACYEGLAVASANLHEDHFGRAYGLTRDGAPATSGCVAFGVERWLYALTDRWGADPAGWPDVLAAAERSRPR
ncbi:hypothetical protein ACFUIW_03690 [Streptomyces sp. NPDC057245]|uniref:hypothetical protein n=1 Tax=Streptomyces sp. NPDC057245 TaxID=3346065 RepID=UPI003642F65F